MKKNTLISKYFLLIVFSTLNTVGNCQTFSGLVNKPVTIEFTAKPSGFVEAPCSVEIIFPNGEKEILISNAPEYKIKYNYVPKDEGTFALNWVGVESIDGKRSEFIVESAVKQIFGNLGQALQGRKLSQLITACNGEGKFFLNVKQAEKPVTISSRSEQVTAKIPTRMAPPIDQSRYLELMSTNAQFKQAIDLFTSQKPEAIGLLTLLSEIGEPYAQLFLGLTYEKEWSKAPNLKLACYWIRKSAEAGISQARLFLANRALSKSTCFDVEPTLEEADVWVKLAAMSNDATIRNESKAMEEAILKIRLGVK